MGKAHLGKVEGAGSQRSKSNEGDGLSQAFKAQSAVQIIEVSAKLVICAQR